MTTRNTSKLLALLPAAALLALVALPTFAGGPLAIFETGQPFLWPNGGVGIPWNPDQGGLGPLDNAGAVALTGAALQDWEDIASATATYVNAGSLPVDVDTTNFGPFVFPAAPDGLSAVVYDEDGSLFDLLFGPGSGVLGFAGPEWVSIAGPDAGTILEGVAFMNGGALLAGFPLPDFQAILHHEFGHYNNLAHTVVNGQVAILGDNSGPTPNDTFPIPPLAGLVETMYPFLIIGGGQADPHPDDIAIFSSLYPEPDFATTTGAISGTIFAPNGATPVTGVNVIARNVADPFQDAVSAISSDFTDDFTEGAPLVGTYTIRGLTPGADYAVYVDEILAGGFSTPPASPLPGPEELHTGAAESNSDDPAVFEAVGAVAGLTVTDVDVIFNQPQAGDPLPLGDDDAFELFLPFTFCLTGQPFDSLFVNSNGSVSFGEGDTSFFESVPGFLSGPPRIAGVWDDLNPASGGIVTFEEGRKTFTVRFIDVPEFPATGANSFDITLRDNSRDCVKKRHHLEAAEDAEPKIFSSDVTVEFGALSLTDGLAGVSGGAAVTSTFEPESDLSSFGHRRINLTRDAAVYELFALGENDLADTRNTYEVGRGFRDRFEPNDILLLGRTIRPPFDTIDTHRRFTEIRPAGDDVDFFKVRRLKAGQTLVAEVVAGQIDSVLGLFQCDHRLFCRESTATLLVVDDDGGSGFLSRIVFEIQEDADYALGVSTFPDFDFTGDGNTDPIFGVGRYVLDVQVIDGTLLTLGDDDTVEVAFGFDFPFQGGTFNSVFVNSNGNLTLGGGNTDFSESVGELLSGLPRIAPLWDDLAPNNGGLVVAAEGAGCFRLEFSGVPEFPATGSNSFVVSFDDAGNITVDYGGLSATDGLVGITEGGGVLDPGATDLSAGGPFPALGTTYELFDFANLNDLAGASVSFGSPTSCNP